MANLFDLTGKTVVVTGAASGIGVGIAEVAAEAGALVVIVDREQGAAEHQAQALIDAGGKAAALHIDLADEASVVDGCREIVARHGTPWGLVNNAGVQDRELLLESTTAEWDRTLTINARGPYLTTRELGRAMVAGGNGGRIVNIASVALLGGLIKGHAAYASSKTALIGLTRASALELIEHRITVNLVLPGGVATPGAIHATGPLVDGPARRPPPLGLNEPRDIGAAVLFFLTPAAARVTNQSLAVEAGWALT
ncbi:MAG: SDR family oxidoreductase [Novosphingobium sp.]|nr:SDR family oxidoreductase [Novosphingobium sp.]